MNVLGPIKKVSISSFAVETISRDIAALHNVYFDHSVFLENEAKFFIKEFEGKRGDRDVLALRQCAELLGATNSLIDSASLLSSKFLDEFNQKVTEIGEVITLQMPKEQLHNEQRLMERRQAQAHEDSERRMATSQQQQRTATINHNFDVHAQLFRAKYAIDPVAPDPSISSSSSAPSESSESSESSAPSAPSLDGNAAVASTPTHQTSLDNTQ